MVLVNVCPKHFPKGALTKIHSKRVGPFKILKQLGTNAYFLELLSNVQFCPIFNVEDITCYEGHDGTGYDVGVSADLPVSIKPLEINE